jgi:aquaporin Z
MESKVRIVTAELIGTFCLVVLTGGAVCAAHLPPDADGPRIDLWAIALANGCALAVLLTLCTSISEGCLNPAITLVLWVCRRLDGWQTVSLIVAQLAGSLLAGLALRFVFPERALFLSRLGTPHLGRQLLGEGDIVTWRGIFIGVGVEALATFVLTVVIFFTILDRRAARVGGLYAGLAQAALTIFGYSLTGSAANPARWFGPAVWQLSVQPWNTAAPFADNMVYWTGPIVGALLAGLLYTTILSPAGKPREAGS